MVSVKSPNTETIQAFNIYQQMSEFIRICKFSLIKKSLYLRNKLDEVMNMTFEELPYSKAEMVNWISQNESQLTKPYYRIRIQSTQVKKIKIMADSINMSHTQLATFYLLTVCMLAKQELVEV